MTTRDLLWLVVSNLRRMKARVAMTAIGVIIGTAAVVVLVSLGAGLQKQATESLFSMGGLDELMVMDQSYWGMPVEQDKQRQEQAILDDATLDEIRQMEGVLVVSPFLPVNMMGPLRLERQDGWAQIYGVDMDALAQLVKVERGTLQLYRGQVAIGASVPQNFVMWSPDPQATPPPPPELLDQTLQMISFQYDEQNPFPTESVVARLQVVGVLEPHGYMYDYSIFMPMKEAQKLNQRTSAGAPPQPNQGKNRYQQAIVKVRHPNLAPAIEQALRDRGFAVQSDRQTLNQINRFFIIIQAILGGIGAVALLVAAFGIANTMVMAIYERTREIGLMKAIGATNQDVMSVFLAEAGGIGFLGGVGGVLLALGLNVVINWVGRTLLPEGGFFGMPQQGPPPPLTYTPLWLPVFAVIFAALIGVISGAYPAIRAAALSPIRALKYE